MRLSLLKALVLVSAIVAGIGIANAEEIRWQGYTFMPNAALPEFQALINMSQEVKETTGGQLNIKMTIGGGLPIKGDDIASAISDRVIQFAACTGGTVGFLPIYGISRVPLLFDTEEELWRAIDKVLGKYIHDDFGKKNVKLLAFFTYPQHSVWTSKRKITQLSDLKGLKIRTMTPQQSTFLKQYGAFPITIATADVGPALQRGVMEGLVTASAGGARNWIDMLKYNYRISLSWGPSMLIANKQAFEKLPSDVQTKLEQSAKKWSKWLTENMAGDEDRLTKEFVAKNGLIVTPPNRNEMEGARKYAEKIWEETAEKIGPEAIKALKEVRTLLGK